MATKKRVGEFDEVEFVPLVNSLRNVSVDKSVPGGEYVGLYTNIYDMISAKEETGGKIDGLKYDHTTNSFIVTYIDGTTETIPLTDTYLLTSSFNKTTGEATFVLNNGVLVKLDLNELMDLYYTKTQVDDKFSELNKKIDDKDSILWNHF